MFIQNIIAKVHVYLYSDSWQFPHLNKSMLICHPGLEIIKNFKGGGLAQWLASRTTDQGVPGSRPGRVAIRCGLEQVTFTHCLVLVKPRKPWTYD